MSMFDDVVLGLGRTGYINESVEPELQDEEFDSIEGLDESVDPMEYITNAIYVNEMNMNNLDKAIMCEEYMYLREHGTEMVYEAVNIKSIIDRAKTMVMNLWNKIKGFLKTQQDKLITKMDENFLKKYEDNAMKGGTGKVNGYKTLFDLGAKGIATSADNTFKSLESIANEVYQKASDPDAGTTDKEFPKFEEFRKEYEKDGIVALLKAELKTALESRKKVELTVSAKDAIEAFSGVLAAKNEIKTFYTRSKNNINTQLKALKQLENSSKKHKIISTELSKNIHQSVRIINMVGSWLATTNRIELRMLSMLKAQAKAAIINAAARGAGSTQKKDDGKPSTATNNSATVGESTFLSNLTIF